MKWFDRFTRHYPQALPLMRRIVALAQADAGDGEEAMILMGELARLRCEYEQNTDDVLAKDGRFIEHRRRMEVGQ